MTGENGGRQKDNMIGMARLSCLPCRRRKSKCDREVPCSSCSLRNTERFCYTSEMEDDAGKTAYNAHTAERSRHPSAGSQGDSPSSTGRSAPRSISSASRPTKKARSATDHAEDRSKDHADENALSTTSLDKQTIVKTIDAMETALRSLRESIGIQPDVQARGRADLPAQVKWEDVSHYMPSREECDLIIDYFFSEAQWLSSIIHSGMFRKQWTSLMNGLAIDSVFIAQASALIALSLAFAPEYHAVSRLPIQSQHSRFCVHAHEILEPPSSQLLEQEIPCVEELQARSLIVTYMTFTGCMESYWQEVGRAIRLCKSLHLHDEDKWNLQELSDWDIELRRRLIHDFNVADRWLSLAYQRLPDLPTEFRASRPSYYAFDNFDIHTGRRQRTVGTSLLPNASWELSKYLLTCGAERVGRFLYSFARLTPDQRYEEARQVDNFLCTLDRQIPSEIDYQIAFKGGISPSSPNSARLACQALIIYTSMYRLRCVVMRQFLLDPGSPTDLRIAALEHARKIVETTSDLVTMSSIPWLSFSSAWCSRHLFCAASTFAIVYLGEMEQNLQDLNWFASKIFEVIEALSFLSAKDVVAKRSEELLTALCTSKDWLRERFWASGSDRTALPRRTSASHDSNSSQSVHQDDLNNAFKGNVPGFHHLMMRNDAHRRGSNGTESSPQDSGVAMSTGTNSNSQPWTLSPRSSNPLSNMAPSQALVSSPQAIAQLQNNVVTDKNATTEAWASWPLLNDQEWFSLLNTLEQDMNALAGNNTVQP